jgi:hypothetical protein
VTDATDTNPLAGIDVTPTDGEVRACRISLGVEALKRLRAGMSCPHCGVIHHVDLALYVQLIEEGYEALREAALATIRKNRETKETK